MRYIGLGGWCGTSLGLKSAGLRTCSLPFDWLRAKFSGVIDCFDKNFMNFLPVGHVSQFADTPDPMVLRGENITFFHDDFKKQRKKTVQKYNRRIERLIQILQCSKQLIFIRTTIAENYLDEFNLAEEFHNVMKSHYPDLDYRLVFIVPEQTSTGFYHRLDQKTYCYALDDKRLLHGKLLGERYAPIFKSLQQYNIFTVEPKPKISLKMIQKVRPNFLYIQDNEKYPVFLK